MRLLAVAAVLLVTAPLQAKEGEEEKRRSILEKLGLELDETPPPEEEEPAAESAPPGETPKDEAQEPEGPAAKAKTKSVGQPFAGPVYALMVDKCQRCHSEKGKAKKSDFKVVSDEKTTFDMARRYVVPGDLEKSRLYTQALGKKHKGGKTLKPDTAEEKLLARWISTGARLGRASDKPTAPPPIAAIAPETSSPRDTPTPTPAPSAAPTTPTAPAASAEAASTSTLAAPLTIDDGFRNAVYPILRSSCIDCHEGDPGDQGFVVSASPEATFDATVQYIVPGEPDASPLVVNPAGGNDHMEVWASEAEELLTVRQWVASLAPPLAPAVAAATGEEGNPPAPAPTRPAGAPPARPKKEPLGDGTLTGRYKKYGVRLPYGFRINGRFDINYERRNYSGNPFSQDADATLRSFHNFLFITRDPGTEGSPFGISIEVTSLQFWEAYYLKEIEDFRLLLKMGRILVPFGAEPLFHNAYGGLAAFDQRLLPVFWAQEGLAANVQYRFGALTLSNDTYIVRGYELRDPEGRLDLTGGFSSRDDVELGGGDRLGLSFGPVSGWYSVYYNGLEGGRRLVMQALDVLVFRPDIPILNYFSAGAGVLRADLSGGGPGIDYYDFGSYWEFHAYPIRGIDIRYRQGRRTFDNQLDFVFDERKRSSSDGSTHALGATFRYRGLSLALHHFWNMEEVDEIDDDILRFTVGYAF